MPQLSQSAIKEILALIAEKRAEHAQKDQPSVGLTSVQKAFESLMARGQGSNLFWVKPQEQESVTEPVVPILVPVASSGTASSPACHVLIEGDNYHALQLLAQTHKGLVNVIYIDPPYNTNRGDFKYNDIWVDPANQWRHSLWLSFIEKRLRLAKELLSEDGIIFVSIDDNEVSQLSLLCDELFGETNRLSGLGQFIWHYEGVSDNNAFLRKTHETILAYSKSSKPALSKITRDPNIELRTEIENSVVKNGPKNPPSEVRLPIGFPCAIEKGVIAVSDVTALTASTCFKIDSYKLLAPVAVTSGWSSRKILQAYIDNGCNPVIDSKGQSTEFYLTASGNIHYRKVRDQSHVVSVLRNFGTTTKASEDLAALGLSFSYPKPVELVKYLVSMHASKSAVVLDFFAGSGTTAQAVMELNEKDPDSCRQCLLVTNNEVDKKAAERLKVKGVQKGSSEWEREGICQAVTWPRVSIVANNLSNSTNPPRVEHFRLSCLPLELESQEEGERLYRAAAKAEARAKTVKAQKAERTQFSAIAWLEAGAKVAFDTVAAESGRGAGFVVVERSSDLPLTLEDIRLVYLLTDTPIALPGASLSTAAVRVARRFPDEQKVRVKELWIDYVKNFPVEG